MLPGPLQKFTADLRGTSDIEVNWTEPASGGPTDGYKVMYWVKPEDVSSISVDKDVSLFSIVRNGD